MMNSIYRDSIDRTERFINNLSAKKVKEEVDLLRIKQPDLYKFAWKDTDHSNEKDYERCFNHLFCFTIRIYEKYYGELAFIDKKTIATRLHIWNEVITQSEKDNNPTQLINELKRVNRQPELTKYIDDYLKKTDENTLLFRNNITSDIRLKFLIIVHLLNEQVRIDYPEPAE